MSRIICQKCHMIFHIPKCEGCGNEMEVEKKDSEHPLEYGYFYVAIQIAKRKRDKQARLKHYRKSIRRCRKLNATEKQELIELAW